MSQKRNPDLKSNDRKYLVIENATNPNKNEPVLELDWSTRDKIIVCLNKYSKVLYGEKAEMTLAKDELKKDNTYLYQRLIELPAKFDTDVPAGGDHSNQGPSSIALALRLGTMERIIRTLSSNHWLLVNTESIIKDSERQRGRELMIEIIKINNQLVSELAVLPIITCPWSPPDESAW